MKNLVVRGGTLLAAESAESLIREEIARSKLPALPEERILSCFDHTMVQVAWSVATWLFVTGAWTGMATPVPLAIIAALFGCTVPLVLHSFFGVFFARWGFDQAIGARATFGPLGTKIAILALGIPVYWGWASIPAVMFGRAANQILTLLGGSGFICSTVLWSLVCLVIGLYITYKGAVWVKWIFRIASPAMIVLIAIISWVIIREYGLAHILSVKPEGFHDDPLLNFMNAVEINVGLGFSWVFNFAVFTRLCKSESAAYYGTFLGWGILWAVLCIPAILAAAVAGASDPVEVLVTIGGGWALLYLILLAMANPSSQVCQAYWISLTLRTMFPRLKWLYAVLLNVAILVLILIPAAYDSYGKFITLVAALYGSLGSVWILDIILRKFNVNMKDVYDEARTSAYYYWKGINFWPFICTAVGTAVSLLIYNPLTGKVLVPGIFKCLGASIPGALVAMAVYYIVAKVVLMPRGIGYPVIPEPGQGR